MNLTQYTENLTAGLRGINISLGDLNVSFIEMEQTAVRSFTNISTAVDSTAESVEEAQENLSTFQRFIQSVTDLAAASPVEAVLSKFGEAFAAGWTEGNQLYEMIGELVWLFENKLQSALNVVTALFIELCNWIAPYLLPVFNTLKLALTDTSAFFEMLYEKFQKLSLPGQVLVVILGSLLGALALINIATIAYAGACQLLAMFKIREAGAWVAANAAMLANPITWIIAGVIALIALIAFLVIKVDGWGETWQNVMQFCSLSFELFKSNLALSWLEIQDSFLSGMETIEEGWYRLQSLWDSDDAQNGLNKLKNDRDARAREIEQQKGISQSLREQRNNLDVFKLKINDVTITDVFQKLKSKLPKLNMGIPENNVFGADNNNSPVFGESGATPTGLAASSIASGGSKTTHITLNLNNLVETMSIHCGEVAEGAQQVRNIVQDELTRALLMVQANV